MTTLGRHPDLLTVKLTLGDGAHLVATSANGWAGPVTLHYGPRIGDPVISDSGTVDGDEVSWTLTEEQVEARAAHDFARLEDNGVTLAAGSVITWRGGLGSTVTQTIASLTAGPPGPTAVSADAGNLLKLGSDNLLMLDPDDLPAGGGSGPDPTGATAGHVWTADGADGAGWAEVPTSGGSGSSNPEAVNTVSGSGVVTLPGVDVASVHDVTMTGNITVDLPTGQPAGACSITLILRQDSTGAHAATWPGNIAWPNAIVPVASTDAGSVTVIALWTLDGGASWFGALAAANMTPQEPMVPTAPGAPALLATADEDSIVLTWEPAPANGSPVTTYKVWRGLTAETLTELDTTDGETFTYDDTGVTVGTTYHYRVSALNAIGEGPQSNAASTAVTDSESFSLYAADDFNRADVGIGTGGPGVTSTGGYAWSGPSINGYGIYSNTLVYGSVGSGRLWIETGTSDAIVEAKILRDYAGIGVRYDSADHQYYRVYYNNGKIGVYRYAGSTAVDAVILSESSGPAASVGDILKVSAIGTSIKVFVNDVEGFEFEDSMHNDHTKFGVSVGGNQPTSPALDDWAVYT